MSPWRSESLVSDWNTKKKQVGKKIREPGVTGSFPWQKSIRFFKMSQNKSKRSLFHTLSCSQGWGDTEGQQPSGASLLFFLDVLVQHRAKKEHRDQKISAALLGITHFCNRSPSFHPNQMVLQPLGREYIAKEKMWVCSCFLNSKGQPDWWNSAKPVAWSVMQLDRTASPGHTRATAGCWWTLQRSRSPALQHPSEKPLPPVLFSWARKYSYLRKAAECAVVAVERVSSLSLPPLQNS